MVRNILLSYSHEANFNLVIAILNLLNFAGWIRDWGNTGPEEADPQEAQPTWS
jgi:hypothetical protein